MLAADHRLRDSDSFRRTVRSGRRAGSSALVLHLAESALPADAPYAAAAPVRVGFVVGRAVGGAVVRNRVRRRLRHLVRAHLSDLPPASALVVRALPPAAAMASAELDAELTRCLERVRRAHHPAPVRTGAAT